MKKYCSNCGTKLESDMTFCSNCGEPVNEEVHEKNKEAKSRIGAGLLAIFLGSLGIHNFYLGYNEKGVAQILLTMIGWVVFGIGPIIASIWAFVEGIMIFTGSIATDANGVELRD